MNATVAKERCRVKICGITSIEDGQAAARLGADALGLVFYPPSPRYVETGVASEIAKVVGPFVTVTGLFVNESVESVEKILSDVPLNLLQFHGDETDDFCSQFNRPYIKAIRVAEDSDVEAAIAAYPNACGILLDTYKKGVPGGTGEIFNWERVPKESPKPIILAGGLNAENVKEAISVTHPYGVDVSGGVEQKPGKKDLDKVAAFIAASTGVR